MKKDVSDLTEGPILSGILIYTVPIILSGILQLLFNAADLVVLGRFTDSIYVGAVGATSALINLIVNLFIGLSVGVGVTVAQSYGARENEKVSKTIHTAMPTAFIGGIILTVIGIFAAKPLLNIMGTPSDVIDYSVRYMRIYFAGMTAMMIYNFGASVLRALGDTKGPLIYLSLSGLLNIMLNVFFVTVFKMNVDGVALATSLSQVLAATLTVLSLTKRNDCARLVIKRVRFYSDVLKEIIRIGLPAGIQGSLFSISNVLIQSSVNSFGSVAMSGNASSQSIEGFVYTTMNSFHATAINYTGQNYGAKKYDRIKKIAVLCLVSVSCAGLLTGLSAYLFRRPLLSIYLKDSAEAIEFGSVRLLYIAAPYFLCGIMDVTTGLVRGIGSSVAPMFVTVGGVCVFRVVWIYTVFAAYKSPAILYISYPISWVLTFAVEILVFVFLLKRRERKDMKSAS